jgi:hypothetical protein
MEENKKANKPTRGKVGRIQYKVWKNEDEAGKTRLSFDLFRSYQSKKNNGEWVESHNFSLEDVKLIRVALDEVELQFEDIAANAA